MMRFREFIPEVFNTQAPAEWSQKGSITFARWQDATGARIEATFDKYGSNVVDVGFSRTDAEGKPTIGRTNTAQQRSPAVFGGVITSLKTYLAQHPEVTHVTFGSSDDPGRSELYAKLAKRSGLLGLEPVSATDRANLPQAVRDFDKNRFLTRAFNTIPTLGKTDRGMPTVNKDSNYTRKYDQFILKRKGTPAIGQLGITVPNRAGDEYTNVYGGGKEPTEFQNQQYIKDLEAKLQQYPNDRNLRDELARWQARMSSTQEKSTGQSTRL